MTTDIEYLESTILSYHESLVVLLRKMEKEAKTEYVASLDGSCKLHQIMYRKGKLQAFQEVVEKFTE